MGGVDLRPAISRPRDNGGRCGSLHDCSTKALDGGGESSGQLRWVNGGAVRSEGSATGAVDVDQVGNVVGPEEDEIVVAEGACVEDVGSSALELHCTSSNGDRSPLHVVTCNAISGNGVTNGVHAVAHGGSHGECCLAAVACGDGIVTFGEQR